MQFGPQSIKKKRTVLLALVDSHHGFFNGVARYAREHNWHLVSDMIYTGRIPHGWRGDGIISLVGFREDLEEFIRSVDLPVVELSLLRHDLQLPCVEGDNEQIGRIAADHFLERGFLRFAWAPFTENLINRERQVGFARRLAGCGRRKIRFSMKSWRARRGTN